MSTTVTVESSVIITRPVQDVWSFVSNPRNEPRWHTDILDLSSVADAEGGPGATWALGGTWVVTVQMMGRNEYEVEITGLEENGRLQFSTRTGPMRPVATYLLQATEGGTRFTRRVEIPLRGAMRLGAPLLRRDMQKRNDGFVGNLERLLRE